MKYFIITISTLMLFHITSEAQILNRVADRTKEKVKNRTESKTDQAIDRGLDKIEDGIDNLFKKKEKNNASSTSSSPASNNQYSNSPNAPQGNYPQTGNYSQEQDTDFSQYKGSSFIPGKNVLFFEDFKNTKLGAGNGNWELHDYDVREDLLAPAIVNLNISQDNWFRTPRKGIYYPVNFSELPNQFTLEYDLYADPKVMSEMEGGLRVNLTQQSNRVNYDYHFESIPSLEIDVHPHGSSKMINLTVTKEYTSQKSRKEMLLNHTYENLWKPGMVNKVAIMRNNNQVIVYLNGKEIFSNNNALINSGKYHLIFSTNQWEQGLYFTNVRVAGDIQNASQEIKSQGKFVTNTIYFDVNSSKIKPESWSTLNNAATAIKASNSTFLIVGHTDSDGADDANVKLSSQRAQAVKNALIREFGIDGSRLITEGKGESEPLNNNRTAQEKAQNRRVEFIQK